jgi:predicted AlkP superfamily phosphohydrolase/phosphomutase/tetratricopeptide (TPR) repeat protein
MPKVLLIGWDGADWKLTCTLLEAGLLPNLKHFAERGVMGALATLRPTLSPMLWTSIATGFRADRHGVLGFEELDPQSGGVRPATSLSRQTKALWNICTQQGIRSNLINWFAGHPAEPIDGVNVSELFFRSVNRPGVFVAPERAVHPAGLDLSELAVRPAEMDAALIELFVPRWREVDQAHDSRLSQLGNRLAECFSVHAVATHLLEQAPADLNAVYYSTLDHLCHGFMRYHPPRLANVPETDFALYREVVVGAYRLHDLLLGRLVELAGTDTVIVICSDHGFHADHLRPLTLARLPAGPAAQHAPTGVLFMAGPGIKQDELVHGAGLLDLAPTLLHLLGLPAGQDMPGRVLSDAFAGPAPAARIPSWETAPGACGMHPPGASLPPEESQRLLQQFVALGYVEPRTDESLETRRRVLREREWNLARVHLSARQPDLALPLLEALYAECPLRSDIGRTLAECQFLLGLKDEAATTARLLVQAHPDSASAHLLGGLADYYSGDLRGALAHFKAVEAGPNPLPLPFVYLGRIHLRHAKTGAALQAFRQALAADAASAPAHLGLAECYLRRRAWAQAMAAALDSLGLDFSQPQAHFALARALAGLGCLTEALRAAGTSLHYGPGSRRVRRLAARLCRRLGLTAEAQAHENELEASALQARSAARRRAALRADVRQRAAVRHDAQEQQAADFDALLTQASEPAAPVPPILVVSGLPRSGTSMMMQMLEAGGIEPLTDRLRAADSSNPNGYYEWEPVRQLRRRPDRIAEAAGRAVKVVSVLLRALPRTLRYEVVFMCRPVDDIAASQRAMLRRGGRTDPLGSEAVPALQRHLDQTLKWLRRAPHIRLLEVDYLQTLRDPQATTRRLAEFLGKRLETPAAAAACVQPALCREGQR